MTTSCSLDGKPKTYALRRHCTILICKRKSSNDIFTDEDDTKENKSSDLEDFLKFTSLFKLKHSEVGESILT